MMASRFFYSSMLCALTLFFASQLQANFLSSIFGYSSYSECTLEELKECGSSRACQAAAYKYCQKEFPLPQKIIESCGIDLTATRDRGPTVSQLFYNDMYCVYRCSNRLRLYEMKARTKADRASASCPPQMKFEVQPPRE